MKFIYYPLSKISLFLSNKKTEYLFEKSKKYIQSWGFSSYGFPTIICYDGVSHLNVGNFVSFASNVSLLLGANHKRGLITTYPLTKIDSSKLPKEANERGDITIGNDVWIGYGVTVIGPVTIGDGAIIGAGALVISDIPPFAIAVGVPAKVIKYRFNEEQINSLQTIQWWNWNLEKIKKEKDFLYSNSIQSFIERNT